MKNEKSYNCISTIPIASKSDREVTQSWRTQPAKSRDLLIMWSRKKSKNLNLYLHFNNTYDNQTWQDGDLWWETPSTKSRERLIKWSYGHYLLNVFKTSPVILLMILSLMSVVLRYLDDEIILILSYLIFQNFELLKLQNLMMCKYVSLCL